MENQVGVFRYLSAFGQPENEHPSNLWYQTALPYTDSRCYLGLSSATFLLWGHRAPLGGPSRDLYSVELKNLDLCVSIKPSSDRLIDHSGVLPTSVLPRRP